MRTSAVLRRPSRRPFATAVVLALALVGLAPGVAHAAGELVGGSTSAEAVPIPLPADNIEGSFVASNVGISSVGSRRTDAQPYWNNVAWYSYTPSVTQRVYIRVSAISPAGWDNTIEVWTAAGSFVAQRDDIYGWDAGLVVTLNAGTEYQIGMGGWSISRRGTASISFYAHPPSAPLDVNAVAGDGQATVTWSAPTDLAGGVTRYTVWCTPDGGVEFFCGDTYGSPPSLSTTVTGLTNGAAYTVRVRAETAFGQSEPSTSASVTPRAVSSVVLTVDPSAPVSGQYYCVMIEVVSHGIRVDGGTFTVTNPDGTFPGFDATRSLSVCQDHPVGDWAYSFDYSGTTSIAPSSASLTVTVVKIPQTVEITTFLGDRPYTPDSIALAATATSGLPVTFAASGSCTVSGDQLSFTGIGLCTVTAAQAGTDQIESASDTAVFDVAKRHQGLFLTVHIDGPLVYDRPPVTVVGGSDLGLPVTFTGTGSCTMVGDVMHATGVGPCTITVSQAGDAVTEAAELVSEPLDIAKRPQTLAVTGLPPVIGGNGQFAVTGVSDVGLPVTLTASGACTISGGVVTIMDIGQCTVTGTQAGDEHTLPGNATATALVSAEPAAASLRIGFAVGDPVEGSPVTVTGSGLRPGTPLTITVYSTPMQIGSASASVLGSAVSAGELPALEAGEHRVVARGTALDGTRVSTVVRFAVDVDGVVTRIGRPADLANSGTDTATGSLALLWLIAGAGLLALRRTLVLRRAAPA